MQPSSQITGSTVAPAPLPFTGAPSTTAVGANAALSTDKLGLSTSFPMANLNITGAVPVPGATSLPSALPAAGSPGSPFAHPPVVPFQSIAPPTPIVSSSSSSTSQLPPQGVTSIKKRSRSASPAPPPPPASSGAAGGAPSLLNVSRSLELQHSAVPTVYPNAIPMMMGGVGAAGAAVGATPYGFSPNLPIHPLPGEPPPPPPPSNPPPEDSSELTGYTKELKARVVAYHFFTEPAPSYKDTAHRFNVVYQTVRKWCRTKSPWQAESEALNEAEMERRALEAASYYFDQGRQMTIPRVAKMYGLKEHLVRQAIHKSPLRQHNNDAFKAQRTRYSDEFKKTCLDYYFNIDEKNSQEKTCAHFGVSSATFSKWVREDPRRKNHPNIARFDSVNQPRTKTDVFRQKRPGRRFFSPVFKQKLVDFFLAMDTPDRVKAAHRFGVPTASASTWINTYLTANPHLTPKNQVHAKKNQDYTESGFPTAKWYPDQLKRELVEFHFAKNGRTLADTSRHYGLPRRTVGKWIRKFKDAEKAAKFEPDPSQIPDSLKLFVDISSESRKKREALQHYFADDSHTMEVTFREFGTTPDQIRAWLANRWLPPSDSFQGNPSLQQKAVGFFFLSDLHSVLKTAEVFNQSVDVVKNWIETASRWVPLPSVPYAEGVKEIVLSKASDGTLSMKQISHETHVHLDQVREWVRDCDLVLLNAGNDTDTNSDAEENGGGGDAASAAAATPSGAIDIDMTAASGSAVGAAAADMSSAALSLAQAPLATSLPPVSTSSSSTSTPLPSMTPRPLANGHILPLNGVSNTPPPFVPSSSSPSAAHTAHQQYTSDGDTIMADIVNGVVPLSSAPLVPRSLSMSTKGVHVPPAFGTSVNPTVSVLTDISKTVRCTLQGKKTSSQSANTVNDAALDQQQQADGDLPPPPPPPANLLNF